MNNLVKKKEFFKRLEQSKILFPKLIKKSPPKITLIKNFKSFGSQHIKKLKDKNYSLKKYEYFQEFLKGKNTSVQFITFKNKLSLISICEQVFKKDTFFIDYLITQRLDKEKEIKTFNLVKKIVKIFNLNGINNIDIICRGENFYLVEINSRPGLSSNIIYKINQGPFIGEEKKSYNKYYATKIIYASKRMIINKKIINFFKKHCNSNNFSELPNERDIIKVNEPICLIHLMAKTKKLLEKSLHIETKKFLNKLEINL